MTVSNKKYRVREQCLKKLSNKLWNFVKSPKGKINFRPAIYVIRHIFSCRLRFLGPLSIKQIIYGKEHLSNSSITPLVKVCFFDDVDISTHGLQLDMAVFVASDIKIKSRTLNAVIYL